MSKKKAGLDDEHKKILKTHAKEMVTNHEQHFLNPPKELQEKLQKEPGQVERALYKVLKRDAEGKLNGTPLQEEDHKHHVLEKLKIFGETVAELLHKLISPFIPMLIETANTKIAVAVDNSEKIPQKYKDDLKKTSEAAVDKIGHGVSNLNFSDDKLPVDKLPAKQDPLSQSALDDAAGNTSGDLDLTSQAQEGEATLAEDAKLAETTLAGAEASEL